MRIFTEAKVSNWENYRISTGVSLRLLINGKQHFDYESSLSSYIQVNEIKTVWLIMKDNLACIKVLILNLTSLNLT